MDEKVIHYLGREIKVTDMKNGKFVWETDRDEFGYVTAGSFALAVVDIYDALNNAQMDRMNGDSTYTQEYDTYSDADPGL